MEICWNKVAIFYWNSICVNLKVTVIIYSVNTVIPRVTI